MDLVPPVAALAVAGLAAVLDLRSRRIPNWLTAGALLVGLALHAWLGGFGGVATALAGAALGLVLLLPFYVLRAMGAGDVKLLAAIGALIGPHDLISVAIYGAIIGGAVSLVVMLLRGRLIGSIQQVLTLRTVPARTGLKAPYGVAIAGGMALSLLLPAVLV